MREPKLSELFRYKPHFKRLLKEKPDLTMKGNREAIQAAKDT
jgi:hypothetical protein